MMFRLVASALVLTFSLCQAAPAVLSHLAPYQPAPEGTGIAGQYIISLNAGYSFDEHVGKIPGLKDAVGLHHYGIIPAYFAHLPDALLELVRRDPAVKLVEQNAAGSWGRVEDLPSSNQIDFEQELAPIKKLKSRGQSNGVGYGLKYLSSDVKNPAQDSYFYLDNAGEGVDVYIMDTGINPTDAEFQSRVTDLVNVSDEGDFRDSLNHGTKVASIVGSTTYGAAKVPNLLNVKINVGGVPTTNSFLAGMQQITDRHNNLNGENGFKGSIIQMSFMVTATSAANDALQTAANAGIYMVSISGNSNNGGINAAQIFPCNSGYTTCVGASGSDYRLASFSNYGQAVNYIASGVGVQAIDNAGNVVSIDGTSFAAPYVAGVVAIFYGYEGQSMNRDLANTRLDANADQDYLENLPAEQINRMPNSGHEKTNDGRPYIM